jgi:ribosomal protein L32
MNQHTETKIENVYHPHKRDGLTRKCNAWDLCIVSGGVGCANCGELVIEHKVTFPQDEKETL